MPLEVPHLDSALEDLAFELDRFELEALAVARLEHEGMGGVEVVPKADEAFDVLRVGAASLAGGLELATSEANVGVGLVRFVVLRAGRSQEAVERAREERTHVELRDDGLSTSL